VNWGPARVGPSPIKGVGFRLFDATLKLE
jgi:hypothetical protein